MKGDEERCLAAGMDAYVAKPINPPELMAILARLLGRAAATAPVGGEADRSGTVARGHADAATSQGRR